jgi:hypothetical protein
MLLCQQSTEGDRICQPFESFLIFFHPSFMCFHSFPPIFRQYSLFTISIYIDISIMGYKVNDKD